MVTRLECGYAGTHLFHNSGSLVSQYDRHGSGRFAVDIVNIGVTQSRTHHFDKYFLVTWLIQTNLFYTEGTINFIQYSSFHDPPPFSFILFIFN